MKKMVVVKHLLLCSALILGGTLQLGMQASGKVIKAEPDTSVVPPVENVTTETTETTEKPDAENVTTEEDNTANTNGWNSKKTSYYVDGKKVTGVYVIENKLYLFDEKGKLYKKTGKKTIDGVTYCFRKDYSLKTGVAKAGKKYYYFDVDSGAMHTVEAPGIENINGNYYCFNKSGSLKAGWYRDENNKRYYFDKKTLQATVGWRYIGKYKFFFNKKGQLQQDLRKKLAKKKKSFVIRVNRTASCVTVYAKDGLNGYTIPVVAFVCSAGNDTPTGTFHIRDHLRWHELMGPSWGQWCEHLTDDILFHSVYYNEDRNNRSLSVSAYNKLGTMASHGCVRLTAGDAKWIYDNCKTGTKVIIYNDVNNPGPFDKPTAQKLSSDQTWDPTDPTINQ